VDRTDARGRLVVVDDERALASALADRVVAEGASALAARGRFDVALAGGSTPKAAYALLAQPPHRDAIEWSRVRFFFGDERCVPPDHPDSNYGMAARALLEPLGIAADAVFRMHGEDDPATAAAEYARVLRAELPADDAGTPRFDLVLLGMGPDGHTASLFPGSDPLTDDEQLVRAPYVEKFATHRITLTPRVLRAARAVIVTAGGAAKADALAAVLGDAPDASVHPIAVLLARTDGLTWLVDRAAAAEVPGRL
jgi:6-phosphogluconolactonase